MSNIFNFDKNTQNHSKLLFTGNITKTPSSFLMLIIDEAMESSKWNSGKIDDPFLSAKVPWLGFIKRIWQSVVHIDNEELNVAWETLNVKWKKIFGKGTFFCETA